jgi:uncharacterized protein YhaN
VCKAEVTPEPKSRRAEASTLPLHEELDALARSYHHLHNEVERREPESATRRRLEDRLLDVRERFDRLLEEWVPDEELRNEWRAYLRNRVPEPSEPRTIQPLVFQGLTDAGSVVEVRGAKDDFQVWVDGTLQERIGAEKDLSVGKSVLHFRWDGKELGETFGATEEAMSALADYLDDPDRGSPPWEYASELLADGLIDVHFDLTPLGRRALVK